MASEGDRAGTPRHPDKGRRAGEEKPGDADDIGDALRSVYDDAVKEDIPSEMLELLGKLN
ncbi:hypothetical protein H6P80_05035 [Parasphingopyxis sp. GrpM-11]|uniref:Anti-sigma factor NepR domain-containing protein n=1 Tax=Parasphingopyxis marina TaxID=2761622 RepID=A0A842HVJ2_9SPHN|nr:hypothetical protein [Parasphingopyxis marina]